MHMVLLRRNFGGESNAVASNRRANFGLNFQINFVTGMAEHLDPLGKIDQRSDAKSSYSVTFFALVGIFVVAGLMAYLVVKDAVNQTIEHQALSVAEIVANQATTARTVYAREIADKLQKDGFGPDVNSAMLPGHVPIPAQFLKLVSRASSEGAAKLYEYKPVSKWNLEPTQGLDDDFLRWAWPELEKQDQTIPTGPIHWKAVSRFEERNGVRVLRYLSADPAAGKSCVACHNAYENLPEIIERRKAAGQPTGKQWNQHQLMGALSITLPLNRAELTATAQIRETSIFISGILIASFLTLFWFNLRLGRQERSLESAATQLANAEVEAQTAKKLLKAKQDAELAHTELSTYLHAIDKHALVSVTDRTGKIIQANDNFVQTSGYTRDELLGSDHSIVSSRTHQPGFFGHMWETIRSGDTWHDIICNRSKNGSLYWVDSTIVPMPNSLGEIDRFVSIRINITERHLAEQEMLHMATHDTLTDLPNRALLIDRIGQSLASAARANEMAAVLFIDLDQFKAVNDSLGHDVGDLLLVDVARRIRSGVRAEDTVARQGGDEFIVLMPIIDEALSAATLAEKVLRRLELPFYIGGKELHIGASIGIAIFPNDGGDVETLLKNSDTAMYHVKAAGRNNFQFFTPQTNDLAVERYSMGIDLRRAIDRSEFVLNYQPIVNVASGHINSVEVLLRWNHPQRGLVPPMEFIPLAESMGLIVSIGDWVLHTVCEQIRDWKDAGLDVPRMAINMSPVQFQNKTLFDSVAHALNAAGIVASALEIEITEGTIMARTIEVNDSLNKLSELGLHISVDDFGTGYSSLSYLKRFPIDTLKIDRTFVMGLPNNTGDAAIVKAIVAMAHSLNLQVVAEGVETETQLEFLRACRCDHYQGYLYSPPVSAAELRKLIHPTIQ